ncbi:MAG TPA: hypothetical protein VIA06_10765 [Candidatus Dormibacteraeota bacterium]|jgi:hypothetical protein|nr:hypothetical protein [Candidatus Dormibacteraeota bacterium]
MIRAKYARPELERRWLVRRLPDLRLTDPRRIDDRYLEGTTLRLRMVTYLGGRRVPEYKLGQKLRPDPSNPARVMHTSIYLTGDEHSRLCALPAAELSKVRHIVPAARNQFGLDVFGGRHRGLAMVEVELHDDLDPEPPDFAGPEVTGDERFSGGWLAFASAEQLTELLRARAIVDGG